MNPKVQDLIDQIKERAAGLEYTEDGLAFDKYIGELDLLLYELRTVAWHLPEGVKAYRRDNMINQWLDELADITALSSIILEELNDEQRQRSETKDANRN